MIGKKILSFCFILLMLSCFCISVSAVDPVTYSNITPSTGSYGVSTTLANWSITTHNISGHAINMTIKLYYVLNNIFTGYTRTLNNIAVNGTYALNFTSGLYWGRDYKIYLDINEYGHNNWHNTTYTFSTKANSGTLNIIGIALILTIMLIVLAFAIIMYALKQEKITIQSGTIIIMLLVILIIIGAMVITMI